MFQSRKDRALFVALPRVLALFPTHSLCNESRGNSGPLAWSFRVGDNLDCSNRWEGFLRRKLIALMESQAVPATPQSVCFTNSVVVGSGLHRACAQGRREDIAVCKGNILHSIITAVALGLLRDHFYESAQIALRV